MFKILAVVVTYNRLNDLKNCLESLRMQTYNKFDILVVNNGSLDGTKEFLLTQKDVKTINQENLGGAGGFYAGMKYMYEHDYEWLWMMDDDGLPAKDQLGELIKYGEKGNFVLNAMVVNKDDKMHLAFGNMKIITEYKEILTELFFHPFNGTFIHKSVIEKIGYIKKEMFIWGDEQEYLQRMLVNGYTPKTVTTAIHYHPQEKGKKMYVFPFVHNTMFVWDKPKSLSKIYYRNLGYIDKTYGKQMCSGVRTIIKHVIAFLWRARILEICKFIKYYTRGRNGIFD